MGCPTKLGTHIVSAFREVLDDEMNVLACTDVELFALLNDSLPAGEKVSYRSFQRYKAHAMACGAEMEDCETEEEIAAMEGFDPVYRTMYRLFTLALINQKKTLLKRIMFEEQGWRRYQWLLERKYREWNLRWTPEEKEEPVYVPVQEKPEPAAVPIPEPVVRPKPEPEMIYGIINENEFNNAFDQWIEKNRREPDEEEIVECRYNNADGSLHFAIVRVGKRNAISYDKNIVEYYYAYDDGHGHYTVRVIPPIAKAA
jgi:hypothetical protein